MGKLTGKTALITGAARGLGRDYALHLAKLGANVGVIDINLESFKEFKGESDLMTAANVMEEIEALGVKSAGAIADIGNREQVEAAVNEIAAKIGDIDILVTNAGGGMGAPDGNKASQLNWEHYHAVIDRNLHGTVYTCNAVAPMMKKNGAGKIITVASVGGLMANSDGSYAHYATAKAGIIHYTHYLAQEMGAYNVNVNCIAPGFIATGRLLEQYKQAGEDTFLSRIAIKRFGTPKDCSGVIEFLSTDLSDYVTGAVIEVTGGVVGRMRVD
ncbi:MAG: SDR family NAD(P)-dependent oxidoreductase [Spirochaetales bacterium]|nr:SDR family NAD(P)-dependent oxidoreductase [Spirochaetales bacterium]